jgi:transcriptional regulator with XRE-family HTH domain
MNLGGLMNTRMLHARLQYAKQQKRAVTVEEVATNVGMDSSELAKIEHGEQEIQQTTAQALATFYGIPIDYLIESDSCVLLLLSRDDVSTLRSMLDVAVNYGSTSGKEQYDRLYRSVLAQVEEQREW